MARAKHLGNLRKTGLQTSSHGPGSAMGHRASYCLLNNHLRGGKKKKRHSLVKQRKWRLWLLLLWVVTLFLMVWGMLAEIQI